MSRCPAKLWPKYVASIDVAAMPYDMVNGVPQNGISIRYVTGRLGGQPIFLLHAGTTR